MSGLAACERRYEWGVKLQDGTIVRRKDRKQAVESLDLGFNWKLVRRPVEDWEEVPLDAPVEPESPKPEPRMWLCTEAFNLAGGDVPGGILHISLDKFKRHSERHEVFVREVQPDAPRISREDLLRVLEAWANNDKYTLQMAAKDLGIEVEE